MRTFDQFRRKFLAKQVSQIAHSEQFKPEQWFLPVNCVVHYQSNTMADLGIRGNNTLLHNWEDDIVVSHILEGYGVEGNPRRKNITKSVTDAYFKKQERMKKTRNLTRALSKPKDLVILDYSLAQHSQVYTQSIREHLYGFKNTLTGMVKQINEIGDSRHHFIVVNCPESIPSIEEFNKFSKDPTEAQLHTMLTVSDWWLREIWNCAETVTMESPQEAAQLSQLSLIEKPESVTIILSDHGLFTAVNLGLYIEHAKTRASTAQKGFATLLQKIQEQRTPVVDETLPEVDEGGLTAEGVSPELISLTEDLTRSGSLSSKERERLIKLASSTRKMKSPFNPDKTIAEQGKITSEDLKVNSGTNNNSNDKTATKAQRNSSVHKLRYDYVEKVLPADIVNVLTSFESSGVILTDMKKEEVIDIANDYVELTVSFVLANGKPCTRKFRYPRPQEDGSFMANSIAYESDLQKVDKPLRKASPSRAAISAYSGKCFIERSPIAKHDFSRFLCNKIVSFGLDGKDKRIDSIVLGSNQLPKKTLLPRSYSAVMQRVTSFNANNIEFDFTYDLRHDRFGEKEVNRVEKKGSIVVGKRNGNLVTIGIDDVLYEHVDNKPVALGDMMETIGGDWGRVPVDMAIMNVFGKSIPMGFVICKHQGLKRTLEEYGVKYRIVPSNVRGAAEAGEYKVKFKDYSMFIKRGDYIADMIMSAFANSKSTELFSMGEFESSFTYSGLMARDGLASHIIKEQEHQQRTLLDPITKELLRDMNEPDEYIPLLKRALELISNDENPEETDPSLMRLRGYERIAGFMYEEISNSIREQRNRPNPKMYSLDIKPTALWQKLVGDSTTQLKQISGPIHAMKGQEGVSLSGHGGRDAKTLVKRSRAFNVNDVGIFSESTPDSAKVAIRTFLTPDAAITNLRGEFGEYDSSKGSTGALSSTSCLLPAANHDDKHSAVVAKSL